MRAEIATKWEIVNGQHVCVEITVAAPEGVTALGLRHLLTAYNLAAQRPKLTLEQLRELAPQRPEADRTLPAVAAIYRLAVAERRYATAAVASELGISRTAAAKRVARARAAGLIPPTVRGKGGWER